MPVLPSPAPSAEVIARRNNTTVLVVDDDSDMREWVKEELEREGFLVEMAAGGRSGVDRVRKGGIDAIVTDVKMPDLDGLDLLREIRELSPLPFVIVVTGFGSIDTAIRAVKLGAYDYITKPFKIDQLLISIDKALSERALRMEVTRLREEVARRDRPENIIGHSLAMQEVFALIRRVSASHANILITGESGTGKELVARAIHSKSSRSTRPFVAMNCAAIPENLLESEFFGYARGAHSTARTDRHGLFSEADGGTLFLDEVAELPLSLQPKLLRVLQDGEYRPLGSNKVQRADVRIIAATHRDLDQQLKAGELREDLYYRLNVIQIHIPPLRARPDDILPLADHFLTRGRDRAHKGILGWDEAARQLLVTYRWPGNVRELENVVERAVALCEHDRIGSEDLPRALHEKPSPDRLAAAISQGLTLEQLEREYIERILDAEGGNKTRAALRLGLDRKTLYRKLEEYAAKPRDEGSSSS